eukprot:GHVT01058855.1.p1 GENE.GHVT01058855.1~~GHVT01058855.1.p1  ORF type:complete len:372 (+),score=114.94 GHVT01058855.1:771-1886(+)
MESYDDFLAPDGGMEEFSQSLEALGSGNLADDPLVLGSSEMTPFGGAAPERSGDADDGGSSFYAFNSLAAAPSVAGAQDSSNLMGDDAFASAAPAAAAADHGRFPDAPPATVAAAQASDLAGQTQGALDAAHGGAAAAGTDPQSGALDTAERENAKTKKLEQWEAKQREFVNEKMKDEESARVLEVETADEALKVWYAERTAAVEARKASNRAAAAAAAAAAETSAISEGKEAAGLAGEGGGLGRPSKASTTTSWQRISKLIELAGNSNHGDSKTKTTQLPQGTRLTFNASSANSSTATATSNATTTSTFRSSTSSPANGSATGNGGNANHINTKDDVKQKVLKLHQEKDVSRMHAIIQQLRSPATATTAS